MEIRPPDVPFRSRSSYRISLLLVGLCVMAVAITCRGELLRIYKNSNLDYSILVGITIVLVILPRILFHFLKPSLPKND